MKELCKYLSLSEDANEASIIEAVKKINDSLTEAKESLETKGTELVDANKTIETQKESITGFEDKETELNKTLVDETIETAMRDGKFDEKDKKELTETFENNLSGLKMIVGKLRTPAEIISNKLEGEGGSTDIPEDRKGWSFRKWEAEDEAGLDKIKNGDPKLYANMYKAEYDVELVTN